MLITKFGIMWGYGVSRIIMDKVVFKLGIESAILPFTLFSYLGDVQNTNNTTENGEIEMFKKYAAKRLFASQFVNLTFSIGFLAH